MDWDYVVLVLFIVGTVAAFFYRRTRSTLLYWAWLGMMQVEVWARKIRDRKTDKRSV